jgi:hypothetical protein
MRVWTVHTPPEAEPERRRGAEAPVLLLREGFAWWAFLFGGLWFLWHRLWIAFGLYLLAAIVIGVLLPESVRGYALFALQLLVGFQARDLRRWTLERHGWRLAGVIAARDEDGAWLRLSAERPDLAGAAAPA